MDGPANGTAQSHGTEQHIRLACQACQRKKIKCDRTFPCGQCQRSSLQCSPSQRKARTRHAGKKAIDSELRNRITKLESLVESLSGEVAAQEQTADETGTSPSETPEEIGSPSESQHKYLANPFWFTLTSEVQALREALDDDEADDDEDGSPTTQQSGSYGAQNDTQQFDLLVCAPGSVFVLPGALQEPSPFAQSVLYAMFFDGVVPFQHYYHCPSLRAFLEQGVPYLGHDVNDPISRLTKASIWYAAVNTLSDDECLERLGSPKAELSSQYKKCVDVLLSQVDIMCTSDLATMQVLITYMMTLRKEDHSRRVWTLVALVVRLAHGMELHRETTNRTPFEIELRRRVWHGVRFIDTFTAHDRGTAPMIRAGEHDTPAPTNINDDEWDESSVEIKGHATGLTDSSFSLLTWDAGVVTQRLNAAEICPGGSAWQERLEIAEQFRTQVKEKYAQYCDVSVPFHRLIYSVSRSIASSAVLRAVRPMQRHASSIPPRVDSPYVLQIALDSLIESEKVYNDPGIDRWRWLVWVPWHALAVCLAGLCSIRGTELSESAWPIVEAACLRHSQYIADTRNGMLWRPIEKLYRRAKAFREAGRRELQTTPQITTSPSARTVQAQDFSASMTVSPSNNSLAYPPAIKHGNSYGSLSIDPGLTAPMDSGLSDVPLSTGDLSWTDWERIMEDFSVINPNLNGDVTADLQQMSMNGNDSRTVYGSWMNGSWGM